MAELVVVPLDSGASLVARISPGENVHAESRALAASGPVQAGRIADTVGEELVAASRSLREALEPVVGMSRQVLDQLAQAGPQQAEVQFGIELTAEAGAVLAKGGVGCHLTVKLTWSHEAAVGAGP